MTELALDIRGVSKRYAAHVAVADLSLARPSPAGGSLVETELAGPESQFAEQ